jgi:uncharacterized protein (TIGR02246 family)
VFACFRRKPPFSFRLPFCCCEAGNLARNLTLACVLVKAQDGSVSGRLRTASTNELADSGLLEGEHTIFLFENGSAMKVLDAYGELLLQTFSEKELRAGVFTAVGQVHRPSATSSAQKFPQHVGDSDYSSAVVDNVLREIEAAWNSGDLHAYAALYSRDAGYVSRAGTLLNGRAEIEQLHAAAFAGALRNTRLTLKARRSSLLTPAVAVVHADVEINHPASESNTTRAITTFVLGQGDEGWRICAAHTTELTNAGAN